MDKPALPPEGKRFLNAVYRWMCGGLLLTGLIALGVSLVPGLAHRLFHQSAVFIGLIITEIGLVFVLASNIERMPPRWATLLFFIYAIINGLVLSIVFLVYTTTSSAIAFFVCAAAFGATSAYGTLTGKDLSRWQNIGMLGLMGLVLGTCANLGLRSRLVGWITTYSGLVIFLVLTAVNAQKLRDMARTVKTEGALTPEKQAIGGALALYLDFISLFFTLINMLGKAREKKA